MPGAKPRDKGAELLGMEQVPEGFTFRREAVWAGLEAQLQPKRKRRIAMGWWAAAAVVLILIGMVTLREKKAAVPDEQPLVQHPGESSRPERIPDQAAQPAVAPQPQPPAATVTRKTAPLPQQMVDPVLVDTITSNAPAMVQAPTVDSTAIAEVAPATVKTKGRKPRFPVAHVNELGTPQVPVRDAVSPKKNTAFLLKPQQTTIEYGSVEETLPARRRKSILPISSSQ